MIEKRELKPIETKDRHFLWLIPWQILLLRPVSASFTVKVTFYLKKTFNLRGIDMITHLTKSIYFVKCSPT